MERGFPHVIRVEGCRYTYGSRHLISKCIIIQLSVNGFPSANRTKLRSILF